MVNIIHIYIYIYIWIIIIQQINFNLIFSEKWTSAIVKSINWRICYISYHFDWFYIQPQYEKSTNYKKN